MATAVADCMDLDHEDTPIPISNGNGSEGLWTHPYLLRPAVHYEKFEPFRNAANQAFQGAYPVHLQPRNTAAAALLLSWEEDDLGVITEITMLRDKLENAYNIPTETWNIPPRDSEWQLMNKMYDFRSRHCGDFVPPNQDLPLLIVYYGGHATMHGENICQWSRYSNTTV
jgi:hypothetical protein